MTIRRVSSTVAQAMLAFALVSSAQAIGQDAPSDWILVTEHAQWSPRDSQGEVVFKDKMWILGGWFESYQPTPRDVWASADGKSWELVTEQAPWKHADLPMTVVFDNKMWLMGGWNNGRLPDRSASNEVWCSEDGANWRQVTPRAGWSPRLAAGVVVFRGRMWISGGTEDYYSGDGGSLKNDVWSTFDGQNWMRETAAAPWDPRAYHQAIVFKDKMYVLGGGNYVRQYQARNDVWCSTDGRRWERVAEAAPWAPRLWFSAVTYRNCLWVLGGWSNNPSKNWGDVWYSEDGVNWTALKTKAVWKPRHEHSAFVFQDKLWIAGGMIWPLTNEVWSLALPKDWRPVPPAD
jgi:hypothetical protein